MKLKELAKILGASLSGDPETEIHSVQSLDSAGSGDLSFLTDKKHLQNISSVRASAVIVKGKIDGLQSSMLIVDNPKLAFAKSLELFYPVTKPLADISKQAIIGKDVKTGDGVCIYPLTFIGDNASIGARAVIHPGAYIGSNVSIGDDTVIHPNVVINSDVRIGSRVIIHAGSVIGSDGFGYVNDKGKHHKIPQVGTVIIEDDVEIGANSTIDRATIGQTVIGGGTKIDNLSQIAHNVQVGNNCLIVSQAGISGSVEIGDSAIIGGQVGVRDHIKIGSGAMIASQSGVSTDIPERQVYSGSPAIPHATWLRAQSIFSKLPDYIKKIRKMEKTLNDK